MLESILTWLCTTILNILIAKTTAAANEAAERIAVDKEREEVNSANTIAYENAQSRADAHKAALNLLNRWKPS